MADPKDLVREVPKKRPNPEKMTPDVRQRYEEHLRKVAASKRGGR